jgi:heme-degrading monooxygenase HmoA
VTYVVIQTAEDATWGDYEKVAAAVGADDDPPEGLIVHAAGEESGTWRSVTVWESQEAAERFREERILPAVRQALGEEAIQAGPPPTEAFEVKHLVRR